MPSRPQGNTADPRTSGSALANVPVSARAAGIRLIFGRGGTGLARLISEEEADDASSITWLSLEYIVLKLSSLPQGYTRTAGTLEVFFDFLILVGDVRMGWSSSAVGHHCWESLAFLANRVHETSSRSLIPPLARQMMIIVCLATSDSTVRRSLFDFYTMFLPFSWAVQLTFYTRNLFLIKRLFIQLEKTILAILSQSECFSSLSLYRRKRLKCTGFLDFLPGALSNT